MDPRAFKVYVFDKIVYGDNLFAIMKLAFGYRYFVYAEPDWRSVSRFLGPESFDDIIKIQIRVLLNNEPDRSINIELCYFIIGRKQFNHREIRAYAVC